MKKLSVILLIVLMAINLVFAGPSVGTVTTDKGQQWLTLPVVHDTTMRTLKDLSKEEIIFLASVPIGDNLRARVQEMVLADVCHVPANGVYDAKNPACNRVHYDTLYQAWTGPAKVNIPLDRLPQGVQGTPGIGISRAWVNEQGHLILLLTDGNIQDTGYVRGNDGSSLAAPAAPVYAPAQAPVQPVQPQIVYNFSSPAPYMSQQTSGMYAPMMYNWSILGVSYAPPAKIGINNVNSSANSNATNTVINIGEGSAKGESCAAANSTGKVQ